MFDLPDPLSAPKAIVVGMLRVLWWLGWDFLVQTVGWCVGWPIVRAVTLGRFPQERFGDIHQAHWAHELVVEAVGLAVLAAAIWWLSGAWPQR